MKISLVIPMYNEASIVEETVGTVFEYMEKLSRESDCDYEVLFSNDGSTDGCAAIAESAAKKLGADKIKVTGYEKNRGKGSAVRHGMLEASGDIVVCTDCDLAYGTEVIGEAVRRFDGEVDVVIGSRKIGEGDGYEGYTLTRKLASKAYVVVLRIIAGFRLSDSQCGFKAYTGEAAHRIFPEMETDGFAFDIEALMIASALGLRIGEMPVKIINHRESKISVLSDSIKMLGDLLRIRRRVKRKFKDR